MKIVESQFGDEGLMIVSPWRECILACRDGFDPVITC